MDDQDDDDEVLVIEADGDSRDTCLMFADRMAEFWFTKAQRESGEVVRQLVEAGIETIVQSTAGQTVSVTWHATVKYWYRPSITEVVPWRPTD